MAQMTSATWGGSPQGDRFPKAHQVARRRLACPVFQLSSEGHLITTPDGTILATNDAAVRLFQPTGKDLIGCNLLQICFAAPQSAALQAALPEQPPADVPLSLTLSCAAAPTPLYVTPIEEAQDGVTFIHWLVRPAPAASEAAPQAAPRPGVSDPDRGQSFAADSTALLDVISEGVILSDLDGRILYMNPAALRLHGCADIAQAQSQLQDFAKMFALTDLADRPLPPEARPLKRLLNEGTLADQRVCLRRRDTDTTRCLSCSGALVPDAAGAPAFAVLTIRDITAEIAAAQERRMMAHLMNVTAVGVAIVRVPDYTIEAVNPFYTHIPGLAGRTLVGQTVAEVLPSQLSRDVIAALDEAGRTGRTVRRHAYEVVLAPGLAATYWNLSYMPLTDAAGTVDRLMIVTHEVTDQVHARHEAERAAAAARRRADERDTILLALTDAIVVYDAAGTMVLSNPAVQRIYGFDPVGADPDELTRRLDFRDAAGRPVPPEARPSARALRGEPVAGERYSFTRPDGQPVSVVISAAPLWENDQVVGAVTTAHDITAQVVLLEQLERERALLTALIENAPVGMVLADAQARILRTNPVANALYNRAVPYHEAYESHASLNFVDADGAPYPPRELPLSRAAFDGETVTNEEMGIIWPDGQHHIILVSTAPIRSPESEITGAVGIFQDITERIRLVRRLETEQARLRAILDALPVGVFLADAEGRIVETNAVVTEVWGGAPPLSDAIDAYDAYRGWWSATGEPLRAADWALARALTRNERSPGEEIDILRFDGTRGTILNSAAPIQDATDATIGAVAVVQDITELREAQRALQQQADQIRLLRAIDQAILTAPTLEEIAATILPQLHELLGAVHLSISLLDMEAMETRVLAATPHDVVRVAPGFTAPMVLNAPLQALQRGEIVVESDLAAIERRPLQEALYRAGARAYTAVPVRLQERLIGVLAVGLAQPGALTGEPLAIAQDVANQLAIGIHQAQLRAQLNAYTTELEQRVAERTAALQASEARFRAIFEEVAVGIAVVTLDGTIVQNNPALERIFGYAAGELVGLNFRQFTHPDDVAEEEMKVAQLFAGEINDYDMPKRYLDREGRIVWGHLTASLVRDAEGTPVFAVGMVEDITAEREAQAALIQAEKLTLAGQLAASFAHEISNPLQSVLGALTLINEDLAEDAPAREILDLAAGEVQRVSRMVSELRDLYRKVALQKHAPVRLEPIIDHVVQLCAPEAARRHVEIRWAPQLGAPTVVTGVEDRLHQVVLNLVLNALDAMPDGGVLDIALERVAAPPEVLIHVRDTGAGIPTDILPRLFDPFVTTKDHGTGLGLYVCRSIIEDHGGRIDVESTSGEGTTFTVRLPTA